MFRKIFIFELQNRARRPAVYLYFAAALAFTICIFATGSLPAGDREHYNSPYLIGMWCAGITMMMMLISSLIMGTPLYRDIEYNTRDYYLTYPITKPGYFWGRFLGSFVCMLFISSAVLFGVFIGSKLGPAMGWTDAGRYGPNKLVYYLYPYFSIALPNLIFTSCLFFGLVAVSRNVKIIYTGGIVLFLGYFLSLFFFDQTTNVIVITLADPFGLNGIRIISNGATSVQQNTALLPVTGVFLLNRVIWTSVGLIALAYTYITFNFEKFFAGKRDKAHIDEVADGSRRREIRNTKTSFGRSYNTDTLLSLTKLELRNIVRDNYFWVILSCGLIFLGFVFYMGSGTNGVPDFPRTVMLLDIFNSAFLFFLFFIIVFYTGETLHRDRVTRYAFINDSLPPPNWVLNGSKLLAMLFLAACLSFVPIIIGIPVQLIKGYHQLHLQLYLMYELTIILPRLLEMAAFAYVIHVVVNNKFVAHGVAVLLWVCIFFLRQSGIFDYNLLLFSYTPYFEVSDMDGLGHMAKPVYWFNTWWLLAAGVLIIIAALFYYRGVTSSFKERLQLIPERFNLPTRLIAGVLVIAFLGAGAYVYYNVSYLNEYLTKSENTNRGVIYEKTLKRYDSLPLPKVTRIKMFADLYPGRQAEYTHAFITLRNETGKPISQMLLDGDELTDYSLKIDGKPIPFTSPLTYKRAWLSFFRPARDTAAFRLYRFEKPLAPGDSVVVELHSSVTYKGFSNGLYAADNLRNGSFFTGGLPGLGYDDDDEVGSPYVRKQNHLPPRNDDDPPQNDPVGIATLRAGRAADLQSIDITVSVPADQTAIAPGTLAGTWRRGNRNFFHYVQTNPGMYNPFGVISARYAVARDSVALDSGREVGIGIYYNAPQNSNVHRLIAAYKDGLRYYSAAWGDYPFKTISLAETSVYAPYQASMTGLSGWNEKNFFNADFSRSRSYDYGYFNLSRELAQQWWRFQVAPNATKGSMDIPEGLATYGALVLAEHKYGRNNMKSFLQEQLRAYLFFRTRLEEKEHPLLTANEWFEWGGKAGVVLYGLRDLIGEDSLNAALREFKKEYAFRNKPPFAGTNDLLRSLQKHTPDSMQYYLADSWRKITLYDNRAMTVKAEPAGKNGRYRVILKVNAAKVYIDKKGAEAPAKQMNDYIDIGIFAADRTDKNGRAQTNPLYLHKYRLTAGEHVFTIMVNGKPKSAGIDPYNKLVDRNPNDNVKKIDE